LKLSSHHTAFVNDVCIHYVKDGSAPKSLKTGDLNCDGRYKVSDVVCLINYLFKGGPSPAC